MLGGQGGRLPPVFDHGQYPGQIPPSYFFLLHCFVRPVLLKSHQMAHDVQIYQMTNHFWTTGFVVVFLVVRFGLVSLPLPVPRKNFLEHFFGPVSMHHDVGEYHLRPRVRKVYFVVPASLQVPRTDFVEVCVAVVPVWLKSSLEICFSGEKIRAKVFLWLRSQTEKNNAQDMLLMPSPSASGCNYNRLNC